MLNRKLITSINIGLAGIGLLILLITSSITSLGQNIPQYNVITDYATGLLWCIALGLSIFVWPVPSKHKLPLLNLWLVKSLVALGFMLLVEGYYSSLDGYSYFDIPRQANFSWTGFKVTNGTENIINLVWLYYRLMPESYHALKVSCAMIGFVAIYVFYRAAVIFLKREEILVLYLLALFPSILFWTSIIGKEPIALLGMSLYSYGVIGWYRFQQWRYLLWLALGVAIATFMRLWLGPIQLIPVAVILILRGGQGILKRTGLTIVIAIALLLAIRRIQTYFGIATPQDLLITLNTLSRLWSYGGSGQQLNVDFTQVDQLLVFIPLGMFTALFRPLPGEILNPFGLLAGLENLLLLFLMGLAIIKTRRKDFKDPVILWATLLVLTWTVLYSFVSYQNLGSAVRFKLQILPTFVGLLLYLGRRRIAPKYSPHLVSNESN